MARMQRTTGALLVVTLVIGMPGSLQASDTGSSVVGATPATEESVESLRKEIVGFRNQGRYNEAIRPAERILDRLAIEENDSPYTIADARRLLVTLTRIASMSEIDQCELSRVDAISGDTFDGAAAYQHEIQVRRRLLGATHVDTLTSLTRLASWTLEHGLVCDAELLYREALDGFRTTLGEDHPTTLWTKSHLAIVMHFQGDYAEAVCLFREVVQSRRRVQGRDNFDTRGAEVNLARMLYELGEFRESEALYAELFRWFENRYGEKHAITLNCMGSLACAMRGNGTLGEAERLLRRRLAIGRELDGNETLDIDALHALAIVLQKKGDHPGAEAILRQGLAIHKRIKHVDDPKRVHLLNCLAEVLYAQGRYDEAEATWRKSAESYESVRGRISYSGFDRVRFSADASPFLRLSACLARNEKPVEAWLYLERGLARSLIDVVDVASPQAKTTLTAGERSARKKFRTALSESEERVAVAGTLGSEELTSARAERNRCRADLIAFDKSMAVKYGIPQSQPYDLARIQRAIDPDVALIAWIDFPPDAGAVDACGDHWACIIRGDGAPDWIRLAGSGRGGAWTADDVTLARRVADGIALRPTDRLSLENDIRALAIQRIRSIESRLTNVKRLVVLPVGPMGRVPVQALTQRFSVSCAPSATVFAWLEASEKRVVMDWSQRMLLALGDPAYKAGTDDGVAALPGTGYEVRSIARMFESPTASPDAECTDRQGATLLMGRDATEDNLQRLADDGSLMQYAYIHLSAHGLLDDLAPWKSALLLAPAEPGANGSLRPRRRGRSRDDRLTAEQIVQTWTLNAELVTLSGCETGLGKVVGGEGVVGFSQALFAAGARSLVLSLWNVDDKATALLMSRFYANLTGDFIEDRQALGESYVRGQRMPKALALYEAKQWLQSNSPDENRKALAALGFDVAAESEAAVASRGGIRMSTEDAHAPFDYSDPHYWAAFVLSGDPG